MNHITLPLKDIAIGKNIRTDTSNVNIGDLVESIRCHGLLENLIVQTSRQTAQKPRIAWSPASSAYAPCAS